MSTGDFPFGCTQRHVDEAAPQDDPADECLCGHDREQHDENGCQGVASSGYRCSCPSFEDEYDGS